MQARVSVWLVACYTAGNRSFSFIQHLLLSELVCLALFLEHPVVLTVMLVAACRHEAAEDLAHKVVVRLFLEIQILAVLDVPAEFLGNPSCQLLNCCLNLFVLNAIILVVLVFAGKSLPGKSAFEEVKQDVADRLHVVSSGLLNTNVGVDRGVSGCAC